MRHRYPLPGNEDEFEEFCLRFYRQKLSRDGLVRYGKRGESQDGIDIIDQLAVRPLYAIQCKHHEPTKTIPPQEIKDEVTKAKSSTHHIDHFIIATTARRSRTAHDTVLELNEEHAESQRFTVAIHFWEDICTHLGEFGRAVAEFVVWGEYPDEEMVEPVRFSFGAVATVSTTASDASDPFPGINALFDQRKLEAAEHEIAKLPDPEQDDSLETSVRYAILRLRGKLALEQLHFEEAARLFAIAYDTCPELQQARQNRVLSLELSGDNAAAFAMAAKLLDEGLRSSFLVSLLVRNATDPADLTRFANIIDELSPSEEDVNLALAMKHLQWGDISSAAVAAQHALEISPDSAHVLFTQGMVAHQSGLQEEWEYRDERLTNAVRQYSDALVAARREEYLGLIPEIHVNRGRVQALLGHHHKAATDFRAAVSNSDSPCLYAEAAATYFLHQQDFQSAWEFVPLLDSTSNESAFLSAVAEYHHLPDDEKREHILTFARLADRDFDRATEVRFHCVQWAIEIDELELARQCVPSAFIERFPLQGNTLLAWIALAEDNVKDAKVMAEAALECSSRAANRQELSVLATLLLRLGEDEKALPFLDHVAIPGVLNDDSKRLITVAQRLDRHDILLRVCSELRLANQQDDQIRKLEVQILSHYLPEDAYALAAEFRKFDEPYFSAAKNYLSVRLGRPDEIEFDDACLPPADAFHVSEAYLVVTPLVEVGRYRDAIAFVYRQLRLHFADERAHGQYIWMFLQYKQKANISHSGDIVDTESAVRLENLKTGERRWLVIEDDQPDPTRSEIASSTLAGQSLLGKRLGDVVDVLGPSVQTQHERVIEIQTKYIRLFQDAMGKFQQRFPGAGTIQAMHLGSGDSFDPTPLVESLRKRRDHVDEVFELYRSNLCSVTMVAELLGVDERKALIGLAEHPDLFVRCVECAPEEFYTKAAESFESSTVVLDLSAVVTLSRLKALDHLDHSMQYLISRSTFDLIATWLHECTEHESQPSAYSHVDDDGQMILQDVTPEHLEHERDEVRDMLDCVQRVCTVRDTVSVASLDPKRRDQYRQVCGLHSLETLSVAKDANALLWTDDLFIALIGEMDFGVRRIWTQLVLKRWEQSGQLEVSMYAACTAKLAAWNYLTTIWQPRDVIAAGELCEWDAGAWPLKQAIGLIRSCPLPLAKKARLAIDVLKLLRQSDCSELKQSAVVQAILTAVGHPRAVEWMRQRLGQFFSIDFRSERFLDLELTYWLSSR